MCAYTAFELYHKRFSLPFIIIILFLLNITFHAVFLLFLVHSVLNVTYTHF